MIVGFKAMARGMLQTQKKEKLISMLVTAGIASYFNYRNKTRFLQLLKILFWREIKIVILFQSMNCLADKLDDEDDEDLDSDEDEDEQVSYKHKVVI